MTGTGGFLGLIFKQGYWNKSVIGILSILCNLIFNGKNIKTKKALKRLGSV
jgi:hypothetical protein